MESERIIWGKWNCSNCGTEGISAEPPPGERQPKCPHCGSAREDSEGETPYLDNRTETSGRVVDANVADTAEELAIATGGADWHCDFCRANNRARLKRCHSCGAPRPEVVPEGTTSQAVPPPPRRSSGRLKRIVVFSLILFIPVCAYVTRDRELAGTVQSVRWEHRTIREKFTPVTAEGWRSDLRLAQAIMPVDGRGEVPGVMNLRDCTEKFHHTERYQCGSDYVCRTKTRSVRSGETCRESCTTSSNSNGSFTERCREVCTPAYRSESYEDCGNEPRYCTRDIRQPWCRYDSFAWSEIESKKVAGDSLPARWESLPAGTKERIRQEGSYLVTIAYGDGKTHTFSPATESELAEWPVSSSVVVVEALGKVRKVLHPGERGD